MSIKAKTSEVFVTFGKKGNIGVIIGQNVGTKRPVLMLAPITPSKVGEPIKVPEAIVEGKTKVFLEFQSPRSIDVVIEQLEKMKQILIADYTAQLGAELHNKLDAFIHGEKE
jgi:hypothetical protein